MARDAERLHGRDFPRTGDFLRGRLRDCLSPGELQELEQLIGEVREVGPNETIVARGDVCDFSTILIDGFVMRSVARNDRRFAVGIHVPGDFVDLHAFALKRLDHDIVSVGPCRIGLVGHDRLERLVAERPRLARVLWFATLLDAAIHRKWIMMLEQLSAAQRVAHVYCEMRYRLRLLGRDIRHVLRTPLTQQDLADMCGVTPVHVNRALRRLKEEGLAEVRRGDLYTNDWSALCTFADFDPSYLYGEPPLQLTEL